MFKPALLAAILFSVSPAMAQDIVGLEDCAQAKSTEKKIGCLQANVEFLHRLIKKNDSAAQARLREDAAKLASFGMRLDAMNEESNRLKSALEQLEKKITKK